MQYAHRNQIDPKPISLREVKGTATDPSGVPFTCVGIFTDEVHRVLRYAQTDENGAFNVDVKGLPDGTYRLVAQAEPLCPANAQIKLHSHSFRQKKLEVHMRPPGIDVCSWIEVAK